jgi:hypothetical protein
MKNRNMRMKAVTLHVAARCVPSFDLLLAGTVLIFALTLLSPAQAQGQMIGINVLLNQPPSNSILQDLGAHGRC